MKAPARTVTTTFSIRITNTQKGKLAVAAARSGISINAYIVAALDETLTEKPALDAFTRGLP